LEYNGEFYKINWVCLDTKKHVKCERIENADR